MNIAIKLEKLEKIFGPALPGATSPECTLSAIRTPKCKKGIFFGVQGIKPDANFYIHFPLPIDWKALATAKGAPDYVNDLKESGPQSEQGRKDRVTAFLAEREQKEAKDGQWKRLEKLVGEHSITITIGNESFKIPDAKIALDKKSLKITANRN
jgi:hypothetical protein